MHNEELLYQLFSKRPQQIKLDLKNMQEAFQKLNINLSDSILIAGTNGKGTTSGFLAKLLSAKGLHVGIYSSPHLVDFAERVQTSRHKITTEELLEDYKILKQDLERVPAPEATYSMFEALSFFEVTTLLAFKVFQKFKTDINVIEVGLGGRLDATNILTPKLTAITSISMDHEEFLGSSLDQIAWEKLGIAKPGIPLVWNLEKNLCPLPEKALQKKKQEVLFPLIRRGEHFYLRQGEIIISYQQQKITCPLPEKIKHLPIKLQENFCSAATLAFYYLKNFFPSQNLLEKIFTAYNKEPDWPPSLKGRCQLVYAAQEKQPLVLDVCHNEDSVKAFIEFIKNIHPEEKKLPGLVSILKDKKPSLLLELLSEVLDPIILFEVDDPRSLDKNQLLPHQQTFPLFSNFQSAWKYAQKSFPKDKTWAICGSFKAVGSFLSSVALG